MPVSDHYREHYSGMYSGGAMKAWRDVGAVDKASNIVRTWQRAGLPAKPRVVEIGCGDGAVGERLSALGFFSEYRGFDLSEGGIDEAKKRLVPGASFDIAISDTMPLEEDWADLVVLSHVIEHLEHPRTLLYEAHRLAPHLIVEVPLEQHLRQARDFEWNDLGHINAYTATSIRRLVQSCNFRVLHQETTNPSKTVATYHGATSKRIIAWWAKETMLKAAPPLARGLFTYHETLLARRAG